LSFVADFTAANAPNYGFNNRRSDPPHGSFWSQSAQAGVGPDGSDAVRYTEVNGGDASSTGYQHNGGWEHVSSGTVPIPAYGGSIYCGFWIRLRSPFWASAQPDPVSGFGGSRWGGKIIIHGQGGPAGDRMMFYIIGGDSAEGIADLPTFRFEKAATGEGRIEFEPDLDTWYKIQVKWTASSSSGAVDGRTRVYIDGDNASESTPTYTSSLHAWDGPAMSDYIGLGCFNDAADADTRVQFDIARFQVTSAFDDTFGDGGTPPPSSGGSGHPALLAVF